MTSWYVVRTQPNAETRALAHLERQSFRAYLPTYTKRRRHARRTDHVQRALFPRYLFVALDEGSAWRPILSTVGVSELLRVGDRPVPVPAGVIDALRQGERDGRFDEAGASRFAAGQIVRVLAGPFADFVGRIAALADSDRVYVLLDFLGREVRAKIAADALTPA